MIFVLFVVFFLFFAPVVANAALVDSGDVNFDGEVNILDAVLLKQYLLGIIELNEEQLSRADMNIDNEVNILDLVYIIKVRILEIPDPEF